MKPDGQTRDNQGHQIKSQVARPGKPAEDPPAGAGDPVKGPGQHQGHIAREQCHQAQAGPQPGFTGPGQEQEGCGGKFCRRQQPDQGKGKGSGQGLVEHLVGETPEE